MSLDFVLLRLLFAFVVAFLIAYASTPIVKMLAFRLGAVDVPKDNRRMHKKPIARLGGLAIFYGFIILVCIVLFSILKTIGHISALQILLSSALLLRAIERIYENIKY